MTDTEEAFKHVIDEYVKNHPEIKAQYDSNKTPIVTGDLPETFMEFKSFDMEKEELFDVSNDI